ncbi:MAG: metal ABC transporter permease [Opitutaceae bacterium]|nr:metal ABC transporter permease [Opitutaceae bacterium]
MSLDELFLGPLRFEFMQRGLASAALIGVSGGLLGPILILRRLSLMGDALSHSLLPGIALAFLLFGTNAAALFAGALVAGLLTAAGSAFLSRLTRIKEDAAFGALYLILFALGIVLASSLGTKIDLLHFLFGNILGVSPTDLAISAASCAATVGAFALFRRSIQLESFDPVFHRASGGAGGLTHLSLLLLVVINLVAALQAMGVVLALGLFLLPAVTAYLWCDRLVPLFATSISLAVAGAVLGMLLSYHLELASGATIVLCHGTLFVASAFVSPKHGILARLSGFGRNERDVRHVQD